MLSKLVVPSSSPTFLSFKREPFQSNFELNNSNVVPFIKSPMTSMLLNQNQFSCTVSLDPSSEIDTVDHSLLLENFFMWIPRYYTLQVFFLLPVCSFFWALMNSRDLPDHELLAPGLSPQTPHFYSYTQ